MTPDARTTGGLSLSCAVSEGVTETVQDVERVSCASERAGRDTARFCITAFLHFGVLIFVMKHYHYTLKK